MDIVTMNIAAHRDIETQAAERDGLAQMIASASRIGSDRGMFGQVPSGARAAAALARAIATVTQQVSEGGRTVTDIQHSAAAAARIGEQSDQEAERVLAQARASAVEAFNSGHRGRVQVLARLRRAEAMSGGDS